MKKKKHTGSAFRAFSVLLTVLALLLVLTGCALTDFLFSSEQTTGPDPASTAQSPEPGETTSPEGTLPSPEDSTQPQTPETSDPASTGDGPQNPDSPEQLYLDPLTGKYYAKDYSLVRPVAISIDNLSVATPQSGISLGDIVIECMVEGGKSRLILITNKYSGNMPIGPVRSMRDYMVGICGAFNTLLVGAGASDSGYKAISDYRLNFIDGVNGGREMSNFFYRSEERRKASSYEHSCMITGNGIIGAAGFLRYSLVNQNPVPVFTFGRDPAMTSAASSAVTEPAGSSATAVPVDSSAQALPAEQPGSSALNVVLTYSYYQQVQLLYSKSKNTYYRYQYGTKAHWDAETGTQLNFENVFILFVKQSVIPGDAEGRLSVTTTGTGTGYYLTGGRYIPIRWSRNDFLSPFVFTDGEGKPVEVTPGKTFMTFVDSKLENTDSVILNRSVAGSETVEVTPDTEALAEEPVLQP